MSDYGLGAFSNSQGLGMAAKTLYYKTDGTGRDTYIKANNGGLSSYFGPKKWPEIGTFASKQTYFPPSPTKPIPIVYYRSDGSGRDNYICSTSGGFHPEGMGKKVDVHFLSTLRSPSEDRSTYYKNDRNARMIRQRSYSPKNTFYTNKLYSYQKGASDRLAKPKFKSDKVTKTDVVISKPE